VRRQVKTRHFDQTIALLRRARPPRPLFRLQQENRAWRAVAASEASALSKRWGLWCQAVEIKDDAVRPASWIIARNPCFYDRAVLRGDLRLSILGVLHAAQDWGRSELTLARAVGANRSAVRHALSALEQSCHVARMIEGKRTAIRLIEPRWARAA
jgi:hypothetical protein